MSDEAVIVDLCQLRQRTSFLRSGLAHGSSLGLAARRSREHCAAREVRDGKSHDRDQDRCKVGVDVKRLHEHVQDRGRCHVLNDVDAGEHKQAANAHCCSEHATGLEPVPKDDSGDVADEVRHLVVDEPSQEPVHDDRNGGIECPAKAKPGPAIEPRERDRR